MGRKKQVDVKNSKDILVQLQHVQTLLDNALGDTDPYFDEETTQEDIEQEEPVFAALRIISLVVDAIAAKWSELEKDGLIISETQGDGTINLLKENGRLESELAALRARDEGRENKEIAEIADKFYSCNSDEREKFLLQLGEAIEHRRIVISEADKVKP